MRSSYKTIGLWVILIILFVAFYQFFSKGGEEVQDLTYSQFQKKVAEKKITAVAIRKRLKKAFSLLEAAMMETRQS